MKDWMRNKIYKYTKFISFIIRKFNFIRNKNLEVNLIHKVHKSNIYNFCYNKDRIFINEL